LALEERYHEMWDFIPSEAKYNLMAGHPDKLEKIPSSMLPAFASICLEP